VPFIDGRSRLYDAIKSGFESLVSGSMWSTASCPTWNRVRSYVKSLKLGRGSARCSLAKDHSPLAVSATRTRPPSADGLSRGHRRARLAPRFVGFAYLMPPSRYTCCSCSAVRAQRVLSFFSWDGITDQKYVGSPTRDALTSAEIRGAFTHAIHPDRLLRVLTTAIALVVGRHHGQHPAARARRCCGTVLFLPYVIARWSRALAWRWLLSRTVRQRVFRAVGLVAGPGLGSGFRLGTPSVGLIGTWMLYGWSCVAVCRRAAHPPSTCTKRLGWTCGARGEVLRVTFYHIRSFSYTAEHNAPPLPHRQTGAPQYPAAPRHKTEKDINLTICSPLSRYTVCLSRPFLPSIDSDPPRSASRRVPYTTTLKRNTVLT